MTGRLFLLAIMLNGALAAQNPDVHFDAAPYAKRLNVENGVGLEWPDIRRITQVQIGFADDGKALPDTSSVRVEYWHQSWKGEAVGRYGGRDAGSHGWDATDDWFNGKWKAATTTAAASGRTLSFRFGSNAGAEFPKSERLRCYLSADPENASGVCWGPSGDQISCRVDRFALAGFAERSYPALESIFLRRTHPDL